MVRGLEIPSVRYVNAQVHQTVSKQRAGLLACEHTDNDKMLVLFPFGFTKEIPSAALETSLWSMERLNFTNTSKSKEKQC